ncbi:biliverdin-producing heme oxygenase [Thalassospira sp.]|uniref:biliverdin-producing heme oxygenase n=1 Tax=Thalassospira sp. TaxID=1912094 RepID=UPI0027369BB0|nr:biliverdin-producing heme oxygenase [Thalassospira sp.]MDP2699346.1 biliverdin-producing heme oxygenase [Thalassospira sp.]
MHSDVLECAELPPRVARLKQETTSNHQKIDDMVMAMDPFASRANYIRFLTMQYRFHRAMKPLYDAPDLNVQLPGLVARARFDAVSADLADLGVTTLSDMPGDTIAAQGASRLGWLYVCEGSSLGAAFLLKAAAALNLNEEFGARHLAGHTEGRGKHWRGFVDQMNNLRLDQAEESSVIAGAVSAFDFFRRLLESDRVQA